ncbi:hypothetical protein E8E14_001694 [Neopestalotiopsis sp. 37M]|nr:hypothetical protein E8E14_001694 [Neopestalotiopsis sp. 37M]
MSVDYYAEQMRYHASRFSYHAELMTYHTEYMWYHAERMLYHAEVVKYHAEFMTYFAEDMKQDAEDMAFLDEDPQFRVEYENCSAQYRKLYTLHSQLGIEVMCMAFAHQGVRGYVYFPVEPVCSYGMGMIPTSDFNKLLKYYQSLRPLITDEDLDWHSLMLSLMCLDIDQCKRSGCLHWGVHHPWHALTNSPVDSGDRIARYRDDFERARSFDDDDIYFW